MEKEHNKDAFIRKMLGAEATEKAPAGFADKVMDRLSLAEAPKPEPLLSRTTWIAIFLAAAALVATMFFIDIPVIDRLFSSTGIQKMSFDIFTNQFYDSFVLFFRQLNVNGVAVVILLTTVMLVVIERFISKKRSEHAVMLF